MASLNKVMLIGNLGRDPELKYMPNGDAVANLSMATSFSRTDKSSGEKKETTDWHRVVVRGKTAQAVAEYMKKGSPMYVEGRLVYREYDKDGEKRQVTEIFAERVQFLGGAQEAKSKSEQKRVDTQTGKGKFDDLEDDIPW